MLIGGIQVAIFEHSALAHASLGGTNLFYLLGYLAALFTFYAFVPAMLRMSSSLMLNLSLITANVWAAIA